jgi:iron-sulfur cluster repair protein YtfE (RIC family)
MRHGLFLTASIAIFAIVVLTVPHFTATQSRVMETTMTTSTIQIPTSVQAEHEAIHAALVEATQAPGRVGTAAKDLAAVLHPHFVREEQIALPPLGLLAPLAAGDRLPETVVSEALAMTDSLRSELPRMLEEHKQIRAAVEKLRLAARAEQAMKYEQLAEQLALHARTEEEILYPAAVLVGDIIRARL